LLKFFSCYLFEKKGKGLLLDFFGLKDANLVVKKKETENLFFKKRDGKVVFWGRRLLIKILNKRAVSEKKSKVFFLSRPYIP